MAVFSMEFAEFQSSIRGPFGRNIPWGGNHGLCQLWGCAHLDSKSMDNLCEPFHS
jgi:hypothetical protein